MEMSRLVRKRGHIQWIDADMSPTGGRTLHAMAAASTTYLQRGVDCFNLWANALGRPLHYSNNLAELFEECGLGVMCKERIDDGVDGCY